MKSGIKRMARFAVDMYGLEWVWGVECGWYSEAWFVVVFRWVG